MSRVAAHIRVGPALVTFSKSHPSIACGVARPRGLVAPTPRPTGEASSWLPEKQGRLKTLELVGRGETCDDRHGRALDALEVAVDCYRRGLREPIPLFASISYKLHKRTAKPSGLGVVQRSCRRPGRREPPACRKLALKILCALPARVDDPPGSSRDERHGSPKLPVGTIEATVAEPA